MEGHRAPSLAGRFAAAIALTVGFYLLALVIAALLIGGPVYGWAAEGRGNVFITIFGIVTGISILVAIVPRRLPFTEPGPRIDAGAEPRLLGAVEEVARDLGQAVPAETYATLEVNAAVTEVSNGFLRGRRRVLIIGLPLLHVLTERGLRGVLAHEFGHYAGGDTRLGGWTWRTRETIVRTIRSLSDDDGDESWSQRAVRAPFIWYGKTFLRITNTISRRQEFAADALAAREVGRDTYAEGLRRVHALAPGFDVFWRDEVGPALHAGVRPPVLDGFARFRDTPGVQEAAATHLEEELKERSSGAYDSHPTLSERLEAIAALDPGPADDSGPAAALLDHPEELEARALELLGVPDELDRMRWEESGERVWLPGYRALVEEHGALLAARSTDDVAALAADPYPIQAELQRAEPQATPEEAEAYARHLLGAALTLRLADAGWQVRALPGEPVAVERDGERVVPSALIAELAGGDDDAAAGWAERARALGIAGEALAQQTEGADAPGARHETLETGSRRLARNV